MEEGRNYPILSDLALPSKNVDSCDWLIFIMILIYIQVDTELIEVLKTVFVMCFWGILMEICSS